MDTEIKSEKSPEHQALDIAPADPRAVLASTALSLEAKRSLIASWASDRNAVANRPTLRRLPNGAFIELEELMGALKALDMPDERPWKRSSQGSGWRITFPGWRRTRSRPTFDDDDPPPRPGAAARISRASDVAKIAA